MKKSSENINSAKNNIAAKKVDIDAIYRILIKEVANYNVPVVDLIQIQTNDPAKVLLATILSARTKDQTTVGACKKLFARIKKIDDLEKFSIKEIEQLIKVIDL